MKVEEARKVAARWVAQHASREAGFLGAYFSGSTVGLPGEAKLAESSDIDLIVVTSLAAPPAKPGKFRFEQALLEVTYLSWNQLASAETVLSDYHLAGSFRTDTIIADPTGRLRRLQAEVAPRFAEKPWVLRRCRHALARIERGLRGIDLAAPRQDQVLGWLFPTGITTHVLLTAALRNPTIRLRYLAVREVLEAYGLGATYAELLQLLGCSQLTARRTEEHWEALERTFDTAAARAATPFPFSSDITPSARSVAIDGSRELIQRGRHQEAVFWITATFARCHKILAADAPEEGERLAPDFLALLTDLGVGTTEALLRRADEVLQYLPRLMSAALTIVDANPDIHPGSA
jgi:hypothetical protein